MKKALIAILVLGLLGSALATILLIDVYIYGRHPADAEAESQTLMVPGGQQFGDTANALHRSGIITHPL
ncbi:hypothetical protein ACFL5W_01560, partial [Thermodesulfobacteriota bacterium]